MIGVGVAFGGACVGLGVGRGVAARLGVGTGCDVLAAEAFEDSTPWLSPAADGGGAAAGVGIHLQRWGPRWCASHPPFTVG